jgi:hypothetical protein
VPRYCDFVPVPVSLEPEPVALPVLLGALGVLRGAAGLVEDPDPVVEDGADGAVAVLRLRSGAFELLLLLPLLSHAARARAPRSALAMRNFLSIDITP